MSYKETLTAIIDKVREDFEVLGAFAFSGEGSLNDVSKSFEKVFAAAKEARELVSSVLGYIPDEMGFPGCLETGTDTIDTDWTEIEKFLGCGPAYRFANAHLYGQYGMQLNHFFIAAQHVEPNTVDDIKTIQLPSDSAIDVNQIGEDVKWAGRKVTVIGQFTLPVMKCFSRRSYGVLDLSQAAFGYAEEGYSVCLGMSHSGPVYGRSGTRSVDMLVRLLESIEALEVILPEDSARRHVNAAARNRNIYSIKIGEGSRLFSMKDGCVYNKKQTVLIYEPRPVEYIECVECGRKILRAYMEDTGTGAMVCEDCKMKHYEQCYYCARWFRKDRMRPGKYLDWVLFCPDCIAQGYHELL